MNASPVRRLAYRHLVPALLCLSAPAGAADKAACKDPAWAPQRLPGFEIANCEERAWASVRVTLPKEQKILEGRRTWVEYRLVDASKDPTATAARDYYRAQGQKSGAHLMSAATEVWKLALAQTTPNGEAWYLYEHGGGNDRSTTSYRVTTVEIHPVAQEVEARPMTAELPIEGVGPGHCDNPPWLVKQFPYFKIRGCEAKRWDTTELSLLSGSKKVEGRRVTVHYDLSDPKQEPAARAVLLNYQDAFKKAGMEVLSDPNRGALVVARQKAPQGEFWFVYKQSAGNDDGAPSYQLTTYQVGPLAQEVEARAMTGPLETEGCKDPAWLVKQFADFKRVRCNNRDYDAVRFATRQGEKTVAGHVHEVTYELTNTEISPTALAVQLNYVNALHAIGAELVSDPRMTNLVAWKQKTAQGELWYLYRHGAGNDESTTSYSLLTIQVGGPPPKTCKLEIYGVNFDFDKATLRPDSEPVLNALVALFKENPSLAGEIGGHTDNVGKPAYNLTLSGQRAEAVKTWLVAHGVAATRLTTSGYGDTQPLVPNTTDENRAKNRRVELKRNNCK